MSLDNLRAFFDERSIGALSESHPLQSTFLRSVYLDDDESMSAIESNMMELFGHQSSSECKETCELELDDSDMIKMTILNNLRGLSGEGSYSILEGLELANDILLSMDDISEFNGENDQKQSWEAPMKSTPPPAPAPVPIIKKPSKTSSTQTDPPPPTVEEIAPGAKKGSFQSGKDKFLQDGGKFMAKNTFGQNKAATSTTSSSTNKTKDKDNKNEAPLPPELEHCDRALIEKIEAEIVHTGQVVTFEEIAGLEFAKKCVNELICWPMTRPDLFQGLRSLPRGLLLFGPPGTGKTLIGKAIAHQAGATFFSISASSLTSKWIGEGEKTVRTLFAVAGYRQPSVVFIDEVDSLLCQRSSDENEASRRIKTEFLVQLDGAGTDLSARVVIVGATNRPEELDEAARRRFVKRIYIPLPDEDGRKQLLTTLMRTSHHNLVRSDLDVLIARTAGFSGADVRSLCTEAAMGPVREIAMKQGDLMNVQASDVPPISRSHFEDAFDAVAPSVTQADLQRYIEWNGTFGSFRRME